MNWTDAADFLSVCALLVGALLTLIAAIGILRFPDLLSRIHSATKPQVLGILVMMLGLALRFRDPQSIGMLLLVVIFQLVTSPMASHMVGRAAFRSDQGVREDLLVVNELAEAADANGVKRDFP